jgi:hypothetical protein
MNSKNGNVHPASLDTGMLETPVDGFAASSNLVLSPILELPAEMQNLEMRPIVSTGISRMKLK